MVQFLTKLLLKQFLLCTIISIIIDKLHSLYVKESGLKICRN